MDTIDVTRLDAFTTAYIEAALWSSTDDDGNPLDDNYGPEDIEPDTLAEMVAECESFRSTYGDQLDAAFANFRYTWAQAGHDFWLTRNRHGAGFWDRGIGLVGKILTDAAHAYGSIDLYVTDSGTISA